MQGLLPACSLPMAAQGHGQQQAQQFLRQKRKEMKMEQYIFDKSNGLWYERQSDYYIPCLTIQADEEKPIGLWGYRHLQHIKKERKVQYLVLATRGRLSAYLADINAQAENQMAFLTAQLAEREGVTEQLKAQDQMLWVQRMNNIRTRAEEIVYAELIYT